MYNVKAAVSRLPFGPETDRMQVTDIRTGHFVFPPVPGEPVRHESLRKALQGAGYEMTDAWLAATGTLAPDGRLEVLHTGQPFVLAGGPEANRLREAAAAGDTVSVFGVWKPGARADTVAVERWARGTEVPEEQGEPGEPGER